MSKISDDLLIRIFEHHLAVHDYNTMIKRLTKQMEETCKARTEKLFIPISLTEQKGDLMVGKATYRMLMDNFERLPQSMQKTLNIILFALLNSCMKKMRKMNNEICSTNE